MQCLLGGMKQDKGKQGMNGREFELQREIS